MVKIGLDAAALAKVIEAGGPEMEIDIQRAVLENFARKHVKKFIDNDVKNSIINQAVLAEVGELKPGNWNGNIRAWTLVPADKFKSAFDAMRDEIVAGIRKTAQEIAAKISSDIRIESESIVKAYINERVDIAFKCNIDNMVKDAVREKIAKIRKAAEVE